MIIVTYRSNNAEIGNSIALNLTSGFDDIQPPSMFHHLPHLIGKPEGLKPAMKLSQGRFGGAF